jgi:ribosomal protein S12 methylthiotransferase
MHKSGRFYIESLGCAKNQVDSEIMIASLQKAGWSFTANPDEADILIVNTCGFIAPAKAESIETGLDLRSRYPGKKIIIAGCLTERYAEELARELPEMDGFWGNRDPEGIARFVSDMQEERAPRRPRARATRPPSTHPRRRPAAGSYSLQRARLLSFAGSAYVKVAEGCGNRCTYCAIPLIRGGLESRPRAGVVDEVRGLLSRGAREIVLIAQDLGSFGRDRGAPELADLLKDLCGLPGEFWARLLYIHPDHFPRDIVPLIRGDARLLPYFDIPFQHASPRILTAMGREADPQKNLDLIWRIRDELPGAIIRSTFLVGFPGETEEDFSRLLEFQSRAACDWAGVFTYSREEDTPAFGMKGRVPGATAEARKAALSDRQGPITERALDARVGKTLDVLVEERVVGEALSIGRCYLQAPEVDGLTVVRGLHPPGSMVRVKIVRRNGLDLEGESIAG